MKVLILLEIEVAEVILNIVLDLMDSFVLNLYLHCSLTLLFRIHFKQHSVKQGIGDDVGLIDIKQILPLFRIEPNELVAQHWNALQSFSDKISCCV